MTSHKGPPISLAGPYHTGSLYNTSLSLSKSQSQKRHDALFNEASEPTPKRQRSDANGHHIQAQSIDAASLVVPTANIPSTADVGAFETRSPARYPIPSSIKQPSLHPVRQSCGKWRGRNKQQATNLAIERAAMRHNVQTKAYTAEPPTSAPRYRKSRLYLPDLSKRGIHLLSDTEPADFFPWTGHHPEDALNELTIRNGFYDKLPASQNEFLTARPSVLSSLKNKSGLQILSSLYASALGERELHGTITAASTFKPPPRVTLTDTKKEAWLRDLADPAIPLRRLSRTIPHGIRGKILLDHCLGKDIPTSRAIWLVKCVGANEIRACKRKGTSGPFAVGGEANWIKDWTTNVEQFLEAIVGNCGSDHWKANINYGLRLVSHIYAEHLLDREEYSKWLINHLATCDLDSLPIWLLIMNIYKEDLLRYRQRGMLLVRALLTQLNLAQKPANKVAYDMVFHEIVKECRALLAASPDCFLMPQCWKACQNIIQDYVVSEDTFLASRFSDLRLRNQELQCHASSQDAILHVSPEQNIIATLDSLARTPDYPNVAGVCLRAARSSDELVKTCLQWAASTYRYGQSRVYAAARLLRIWNEHSVDLQGPLLDFLAHGQHIPNIDEMEFYRLCAELISSKHLSVGRYFQWLIARGALHKHHEKSQTDDFGVRLLREIPLRGMPDHVLNLRRSLLSSIGVAVGQESTVTKTIQAQISQHLPSLFSRNGRTNEKQTGGIHLCPLSRSLKSEIAWWIRKAVATHQEEQKEQLRHSAQEPDLRVSEEDFAIIRHVFEDLQEYGIFVDVLCALAETTRSGALLTAITDTVNYHFDTFNALGAANHVFHILFSRRRLLQSREIMESSFIHTLIDLAIRLPNTTLEVNRLRKDEISLDPKQSAAAPSPISDNMVEAVHSDNPTFFEEMDQILINGTSMDQMTLTRCFGSVTDHLEKSWGVGNDFPPQYPELLTRLRAFDRKSFDALATPWLDSLVSQTVRPRLSLILVPLICHNVCTLGVVIDRVTKYDQNQAHERGALVALELLELLSTEHSQHMPSVEYRSYRFLHQRNDILQTHTESIVSLIYGCIQTAGALDGPIRLKAEKLLRSTPVKSLIKMLIAQIAIADKPIMQHDPAFRSALKAVVSQEELPESTHLTVSQNLTRLLDNVSIFNRALSQLTLQNIIESPLETGYDISVFADILVERLKRAPQSQVSLWSYLLLNLPVDCSLSIHERALEAILSEIGSDETSLLTDGASSANHLMDIVVVTSLGIPDAAALSIVEQILERLFKLVSPPPLNITEKGLKPKIDRSAKTIHILLRLLTIHQATLLNPRFSQTHLARLCMSLVRLHSDVAASSRTPLAKHIFDVLAVLSDSLSQDARSHCVRTLLSCCQGLQNAQINFLFGDTNATSAGEWLRLVSGATPTPRSMTCQPYTLRQWEMMQDATPMVTENDTSLSLTLFTARKSVL